MQASMIARLLSFLPSERRERLLWHVERIAHPARLGTLRRTAPLSDRWGYDRGTPVDRYYIEQFLNNHRTDIRGRVLEVKNSDYTQRFGGAVERSDVLDIDPRNRRATIIADLAAADAIAPESFDCFILTQTLQFIYDVRAAIAHAHRLLCSGGALLVTLPAVSQIDRAAGLGSDYWRFSVGSCARLFGDVFGTEQVITHSHGNVLAAIAFLSGMASEELTQLELDTNDPYFPLIVTVRAVKK